MTLAHQGLEVECKAISDNKGRRIHRLDALNFWGEAWKDISSVAQHLHTGMAVVLTVPYRLPAEPELRAALAREVVSQIVAGSGARLGDGSDLRVQNFDPEPVKAAIDGDRHAMRIAIDVATGTTNREAALYGTPAGGLLAFVMQSAVEDDVLDQVFATLNDSASRQFTGQRGALFWVALQGIDADQLMSVHEQDSDPGQRPTGLRLGVSNFLTNAPDHIVGVVFGSRSGLYPTEDGNTDMGGMTNFFLKEESSSGTRASGSRSGDLVHSLGGADGQLRPGGLIDRLQGFIAAGPPTTACYVATQVGALAANSEIRCGTDAERAAGASPRGLAPRGCACRAEGSRNRRPRLLASQSRGRTDIAAESAARRNSRPPVVGGCTASRCRDR